MFVLLFSSHFTLISWLVKIFFWVNKNLNLEGFYWRSSDIFGSKYYTGGWLTKLDLLTVPKRRIFLYGNSKLSRYGLEKQFSTISAVRKLKVWRTRCPFCRSVRNVGSYVFYSCTPELSPPHGPRRGECPGPLHLTSAALIRHSDNLRGSLPLFASTCNTAPALLRLLSLLLSPATIQDAASWRNQTRHLFNCSRGF